MSANEPTQARATSSVTADMNVTPSDEVAAANESAPLSHERPTFSLRAEQVRQAARAAASAEVQKILEQSEAALRVQRERQALELLAAESQATRAVPWRLPAGVAALAALVILAYSLLDGARLSDDPQWSFTLPEMDVATDVAYSHAHAEREVTTRRVGSRANSRGPTSPRAECDPNSFDPIDACL